MFVIFTPTQVLRNRDPGNPNWEFLQMILDYKEQLEFNPLVDGDPMSNHQITVCIRYIKLFFNIGGGICKSQETSLSNKF